jgi:hypothetical protein
VQKRTGEKVGWIGGWTGGFIWVLLLSGVLMDKGDLSGGMIGIVLFLLAVTFIVVSAPWKHPSTRYWKLFIPLYFVLFVSLAWAVWTGGGFAQLGLHPLSVVCLLPIFLPFVTAGRKRWEEQ